METLVDLFLHLDAHLAAFDEVVARLERLLREQHAPSALFPFPALDRPTP
mgnify:CR=1 FL=1